MINAMMVECVCRRCGEAIADGELVLDQSLDGAAGEHSRCPASQLNDDWRSRLTATAAAR